MKINSIALLIPVLFLSSVLSTGCSGKSENTVVETPPMTEQEEATYEEETMASADDEEQN